MWWYVGGRGVGVVLGEGRIFTWGAFFHLFESLTLYCAWVGLIGCMSIFVVVILFSMFVSSCEICGVVVSVV